MNWSNIMNTSAPPICSGEHAASYVHSWPPDSYLPSDINSYLFYMGLPAIFYAILWGVRHFGPYVFTEAKSPIHRRKNAPNEDRLVTHIHGKWYDISEFEHPGGPIAVSLVHRRDGTALFESHHPFITREKLLKILSKYEISQEKVAKQGITLIDPRDAEVHYVWEGIENDKFASDLKALVNEYFSSIAKERGVTISEAAKATPARWCLIMILMVCFSASLPWYINGNWATLFLTPFLAWVTAVNYWHDGLHFSLSTNWRINAWLPYLFPYYSSPWMWYHEHVIGHHAYPNVSHKDPDLAHAPQLMREHGSIKWKPSHVGQSQLHRVMLVWSVALGIGLSLLNDIRANLKLSYNNAVPYEQLTKPRLIAHILGRMGYAYIVFIWPYFVFPLWKAIIWATVPATILSICFMINTQINHLTDICAHASDTNFFKHQVVTAQNFGNGSLFCYYMSGGLNYQIEHHLFPNINHCHLPALSPKIKQICEKHGVPYHHALGYRDAISRHFAHTVDMEKQPS